MTHSRRIRWGLYGAALCTSLPIWAAEPARSPGVESAIPASISAEAMRLAQANTDAPPDAPSSQSGVLEEVTVTARRREESLQDVPLSVVAIGTEQLEARGIDSTEALNRQVPNLSVAGTSFFGRQTASFRMRGLPDVAVYVDGIVNSSGAGGLGTTTELERVEVLRGPQGTLFGRGSIGGAIQYVTQRPGEEFGARVKTTFGSYDRFDVVANVDLPFSETVRSKLTAAKLTRDGYLPSVTTGNDLGSQDDTLVRADFLWEPTDRFSWRITGEFNEQETNGNPSTVWALNPVCVGDTPPPNFLGSAPNFPCVARGIGLPFDEEWIYGPREQWRTASDYNGPGTYTDIRAARTDVNFELTDAWAVRGLAGYRQIETTGYADFDGTPLRLFDGQNYSETVETSAELQVLYSGEKLTGTTGTYFYSNYGKGRRMNWIANDWHIQVNPQLNAAARAFTRFPGPVFPSILVDSLTYNKPDGWALFSEWSYEFTEKFTATLGARYQEDRVDNAAYAPRDPLPAECCTPVLNVERASAAPLPFTHVKASFSNVSPRLSLQYHWTPRIMTYATYSQGFGSGGVNTIVNSSLPGGFFQSQFEPETLHNYELGLRSDLLDGRLRFNLTGFFGKYEDIQVSLERLPRFPTTENAGEAEVKGVELETSLFVTDDFSLNLGAGYLDSGFTGLAVGVQGITTSTPFPYAPEFAFNAGAQYDFRLANGVLSARADYGWQDDQYTGLGISGTLIPAYGLLSARLTYRPAGGEWDVALFGSNLTDEYYRINGFFIPADQMDNGTLGRPREWGLTLSFYFD